MTDQRDPTPILTRAFVRHALFVASLTVVLLILGLPFILGFIRAWVFLRPACDVNARTPQTDGLAYQDIVITLRDGRKLAGFYIPGTLDALILSPPAYGSSRSSLFDELIPLARRGYPILTWDSRPCIGQPTSIGYWETEDIGDVLAYVRSQPSLPQHNWALHGFSAGGAAATMGAARYPDIVALVTEGGFPRWDELSVVSYGSGWLEWLFGVGGNLAYRLTIGVDATVLDPLAAIPKVVPRPILLVYGELENSLNGARRQLSDALSAQPDTMISLWVVPGADHGWYTKAVGSDYERRVGLFYDCALFSQNCQAWRATLGSNSP